VRVRRKRELLHDVVEDGLRTIGRQVGEDNDDRLVLRVVAVSRSGVQQSPDVTVHELDDGRLVPVGDPLGSEPERLALQGPGHEGTDSSSATEILVRPGDEGLDPVCDGLQRSEIAAQVGVVCGPPRCSSASALPAAGVSLGCRGGVSLGCRGGGPWPWRPE
jgi:hypothetical protein